MLWAFKWAIIYFHKWSLLVSKSIKRKRQLLEKWFFCQETLIKQNKINNDQRASVLGYHLRPHSWRSDICISGNLVMKKLPFSLHFSNCTHQIVSWRSQSALQRRHTDHAHNRKIDTHTTSWLTLVAAAVLDCSRSVGAGRYQELLTANNSQLVRSTQSDSLVRNEALPLATFPVESSCVVWWGVCSPSREGRSFGSGYGLARKSEPNLYSRNGSVEVDDCWSYGSELCKALAQVRTESSWSPLCIETTRQTILW